MSLRNFRTIAERRKFIEKIKKLSLSAINVYPKSLEPAQDKNCENMIGATSVPLGVAGPLRIEAESSRGDYYIPLTTTEGALVASVNRGCKAITESGGAKVVTELVGVTRGPVFSTDGIKDSLRLRQWLDIHFDDINHCSRETSAHLRLLRIDTRIVGRLVYARFYYDTADAMGMNMVTIATDKVVRLIEKKTGTVCLSLAGNFDIDKKAAWLNFISGRGRRVWAEVMIPERVIRGTLKTRAVDIYNVWLGKCMLGSIMSGAQGFNAHAANVIAAIFIATGQDPAHVVEGSLGVTTTEVIDNKNLYISIYLPDLMVGTVGGGTRLPSQKEALAILGIFGGSRGQNASKFAEVVGGAVLAGEISLLASLAEGSLASAHQKLARENKLEARNPKS